MRNPYLSLKYFAFIITILFFSCQSDTSSSSETSQDASEIEDTRSFSAAGKYEGTTPCADCVGIFTTLRLEPNFTFRKHSVYLNKSEDTFVTEGSFTFDPETNIVTLDSVPKGPNQYLLEGNQIIQLDMNGELISGELAKKYHFAKVD